MNINTFFSTVGIPKMTSYHEQRAHCEPGTPYRTFSFFELGNSSTDWNLFWAICSTNKYALKCMTPFSSQF
jgi:hypothetical protein